MTDFKSQFKNIETVEDYQKFKVNLIKAGPSNSAKPVGAYQDFFEDSELKPLKKPSPSNEVDILNMMRPNNYQDYGNNNNNNYNNYNNNNNYILNDSQFFKENIIPKEDPIKRNDGFSNGGGLVSNESMIDTSILNMLNVGKSVGVKSLIEVNPTNNSKPLAEKKNSGSDFGLKGLLSDVDKLLNRVGGGANSNVANSMSNKYDLNLNLPPLTSSNSSNTASSVYQRLKINERPDLKPNYIDNNDVRSYLNSLNIKVPPKNETKPQDNKSESASSKKSEKNKKKTRKHNAANLSIIEDDSEGEEEENVQNKKSRHHTKKHAKPKRRSDSENSSHSRKRKKGDSKYEEDLTGTISENNISLQSANHFNEKYLQNGRKNSKNKDNEKNLSIISETSLPPKRKDMTQEEYLKKKYRRNKNNGEDKIDLEFLDEICEVLCVNCDHFIHFKEVDDHSKNCNANNTKNKHNTNETIDSINSKIKTLHTLLKYKLKKLKDHFKNEVKYHENLFNHSIMTLDCIEQIIINNSNIYTLVSNIKDLNMFNKCINDSKDDYKKVVLEVAYRFKPLTKLKIRVINPKHTWEELKNLREQSIINSNDQSILNKSVYSVNFDKKSQNNLNLNKSILDSSSFLKNNSFASQNHSQPSSFIGSSRISNAPNQKDLKLKEFMKFGVNLKLELDRDHPGRSFDLREGFRELEEMGLRKEEWGKFLKDKFEELVIV